VGSTEEEEEEAGPGGFPCLDHSAVAKAHHKNVNEVDRQRAKTHQGNHRDPPTLYVPPFVASTTTATTRTEKKGKPIERNIC